MIFVGSVFIGIDWLDISTRAFDENFCKRQTDAKMKDNTNTKLKEIIVFGFIFTSGSVRN